jgi:menaquinone-dependent protoporphyrinogen oxidase
MNNLIVYASKLGTTKCCFEHLSSKLLGETTIINIRKDKLHDFDTIIIGGSIYTGQIQEALKNYSHNHIYIVTKKRLGLFICNYVRGGNAISEFEEAFPFEFKDKAILGLVWRRILTQKHELL